MGQAMAGEWPLLLSSIHGLNRRFWNSGKGSEILCSLGDMIIDQYGVGTAINATDHEEHEEH